MNRDAKERQRERACALARHQKNVQLVTYENKKNKNIRNKNQRQLKPNWFAYSNGTDANANDARAMQMCKGICRYSNMHTKNERVRAHATQMRLCTCVCVFYV